MITAMRTSPGRRKNASEIVPFNWVDEENSVGIGVPWTEIWEPGRKFVPVTRIAIASAPAAADGGVNPVMVGATFRMFTLKLADPPPGAGFEMSPFSVPGFAVSGAGNGNTMLLPETVPRTLPSVADVTPLKPVPCTVTLMAADPAGIEVGSTLATVGARFDSAFTVNKSAALVPPPGGGFVIDTA